MSIITVSFSTNIAVRYPEVFSFYLNESEVLQYTDIDMKGGDLAKEMGSFFMGFGDDDQIYENTEYTKDPVFDDKEMEVLLQCRSTLNILALAGIVSLAIFVGIFVYFIKTQNKDLLWKYGKGAAYTSVIVNIIYNVLWGISPLRKAFFDSLTNVTLTSNSNLYLIVTKGNLSTTLIIVQGAIAAILIILIAYITRKITRSRRIFTR